MKKSVNLGAVFFIFAVFLLVSCSRVPQGEKPLETEAALRLVQTGTQGVEIKTIANYPPALLYDKNPLTLLLEVRNRGSHDLETQDCFVEVTGFDPNIIGGMTTIKSCAENAGGTLEGKNVYNTEGGFNQLEFTSSPISLPERVFTYDPMLNIVMCYNYQTSARPVVCVDPLIYQVTSEQKGCLPKDISLGGGQGAPVGVSYVGVDMVGQKAIFEINIKNFASGRVLSSDTDIRNCAQTGLDYRNLDKVNYEVSLSSGTLIDCKPRDHIVRLINGQGKIVCTFEIPGGAAYETPLAIDLDYSYVDSTSKQIKVIKSPE